MQLLAEPHAPSAEAGAAPRAPETATPDHSPTPTRWVQWIPLALALIVFAQVAMRGMQPALAESRRLGRAEERLAERYQRASTESDELSERLRAQADPIYLERERRLLRAPVSPLRSGDPLRAGEGQ